MHESGPAENTLQIETFYPLTAPTFLWAMLFNYVLPSIFSTLLSKYTFYISGDFERAVNTWLLARVVLLPVFGGACACGVANTSC